MSDPITLHPAAKQMMARLDGWQNVLTGLGDANRDKRLATSFGYATILSSNELDQLYHGDDVIARICDRPADEMTRQGIRLQHDGEPEDGKAIMQALDDLEAMERVAEAVAWARLHGGSIILLGAEDGGSPAMPLREDQIRTFDWLTVLDRWEVQVRSHYVRRDAKKYGLPEFYSITSSVVGTDGLPYGTIVHESRILRFDGVRTSRRERIRNAGWARGVVERIYPVVRDFAAAYGGMAHLLQDFSQAVFTIKGLANMIAQDQDELVLRRLALLDMARSVARAVPIDEGENLERKATPVAGLPELLDRMGERLSVATDMPVSILMGRAPAGLSATGESDIRLWYDKLKSEQQTMLRRPLNRIVKLTMLAKAGPTKGAELDNWSIAFNPLWQQDETEMVAMRKAQAEADAINIGQGVLHPEEVRQSRFGGDCWSPETQLDPKYDEMDALLDAPPPPEPGADVLETPEDEDPIPLGTGE